ncbi:hypothetical protein LSH36_19g12013 [Paralvinella palmiformis]|uniref:Large ribosomal subunit protein eL36 n=1 Tax=Paralvinella palmiformis TaxID=53620 RepID=A0AAD9NFE9_9ANNE|nr:hypothetical protein LSH36_19g12013 [Paralvinella palmiformis]
MAIRYQMAVGLQKGHKVTKNTLKPRPSRRKGLGSHVRAKRKREEMANVIQQMRKAQAHK